MSTPQLPDDERTMVAGPAPAPVGRSLGANALPAGTRLHEFEIVDLIGEGGFGIVYLARDCVLERKVALKEYLPASLASRGPGMTVSATSSRNIETFQVGLRSFVNEAKMLAQFDHPALVKVHRFWEANGTAYMVMPYYEGITLKETLRQSGTPPHQAYLMRLLEQLLDALEVLHRANALHRDIAPDNILILADGRPVLLDFGAARRVITDRTQALTVILKPGFAPLEQYAETPSLRQGPWTDLYALAAVAYFAITGAAPVPAAGRTVADPLVPLERAAAGRYSAELLRGLDRALALNPQNRPQSVAEFRSALRLDKTRSERADALDARGGPATSTEQGEQRRRIALAASIVIGTIGAVAAAAFFVSGKQFMSDSEEVPAPGKVAPSPPATAPSPPATPPSPPVALPSEQPPSQEPSLQQPAPQQAASPEGDRNSALPKSPEARSEPAPRVVSVPRKPESGKANVTQRPPKVTSKPAASSIEIDSLVAGALRDGEKCLAARQYDCAIAYANTVLRFDPGNAQGQRLKAEAFQAQQRALSGIKIE